ncbi:hypothetical protein V5F59_20525 [Xanthobacter autotrophicus DSM 431]|uniref:hypothetical protein n=1 Tax=Xanthobacter nonsaccharivorans TaxID=3119912 RepID=UPI003727FAEE
MSVRAARSLAAGIAAVALLVASAAGAAAQSSGSRDDKSCAQYGPGFQKMPGSDSCVRTRAGVQADGIAGRSVSSTPAQNTMGSTNLGTSSDTSVDPWKAAR